MDRIGTWCQRLDMDELFARYERKEIDFSELKRLIVAANLPPHPLGNRYLMMSPPPPPHGVPFDPGLMPEDWKGTFGEVAIFYFRGKLSRREYDEILRLAHPDSG